MVTSSGSGSIYNQLLFTILVWPSWSGGDWVDVLEFFTVSFLCCPKCPECKKRIKLFDYSPLLGEFQHHKWEQRWSADKVHGRIAKWPTAGHDEYRTRRVHAIGSSRLQRAGQR